MELRKLLKFGGTVGFTIPAKYAKAMDLHWKGYIELSLENDSLIVRKHANANVRKGVVNA